MCCFGDRAGVVCPFLSTFGFTFVLQGSAFSLCVPCISKPLEDSALFLPPWRKWWLSEHNHREACALRRSVLRCLPARNCWHPCRTPALSVGFCFQTVILDWWKAIEQFPSFYGFSMLLLPSIQVYMGTCKQGLLGSVFIFPCIDNFILVGSLPYNCILILVL